jgi:hypothetical protein
LPVGGRKTFSPVPLRRRLRSIKLFCFNQFFIIKLPVI